MHLGGELDGQARFARLAYPAMESATCSNEFGSRSSPSPNEECSLSFGTKAVRYVVFGICKA